MHQDGVTPVRKLLPISTSQLHNDTVAEIAKIDAVLASVTPPCRNISSIPSPRTINLTPRTDYSRSPQTKIERNVEKMQISNPINDHVNDKREEIHRVTPVKEKISEPFQIQPSSSPTKAMPGFEQETDLTFAANITPEIQSKYAPATFQLTPGTKLKTSLTREKLIQNFKEALELNIKAKNRYCKYEKEYLLKIGESRKVELIEAKMNKLDGIRFEAIKGVEAMTTEWTTVCFLLSREA